MTSDFTNFTWFKSPTQGNSFYVPVVTFPPAPGPPPRPRTGQTEDLRTGWGWAVAGTDDPETVGGFKS